MFVIARDAVCLVTDAIFPVCVAAHIVPQSRPNVSLAVKRSLIYRYIGNCSK